jgi:hypothetical protein
VGNFNAGAAGLILLLTSFCRGWKIGLCATLAGGVALMGHLLPLPALGPFTAEGQSMALGFLLILIGVLLLREKRAHKPEIGWR